MCASAREAFFARSHVKVFLGKGWSVFFSDVSCGLLWEDKEIMEEGSEVMLSLSVCVYGAHAANVYMYI